MSKDPSSHASPGPAADGRFLTTRWSLVEAAGAIDTEGAREALAELCQVYWYPLYAFVRRSGVAANDAEDVVQGFFVRLIETRDLERVVRGEGRFRSFLRVAVRNHLANVRAAERAQKRGSGRVHLRIDFEDAAQRFASEPAWEESPERAFDRLWALELVERALQKLEREYASDGRAEVFAALSGLVQGLGGSAEEETRQAQAAERLSLSEGALRVAVHRLRKRFRAAVRRLIAETLTREEDLEAELDDLFRALAGG